MDCNLNSNQPVKSLYKYGIISKSCKGSDFTTIDRCRYYIKCYYGQNLEYYNY